ncbi:MAG: exodeoxyribonuclease V subunit beta [Endozoicomonadaceae bacterium]|nr:exodeoxyribonuclease V subunit beta [Endozoicomonadaceae bacterium]
MNSISISNLTPLDAACFPLFDHQLIEASAGTGKTYTIANLYLRLLIGHGQDTNAPERAYTPREILVVTFTEAATQELKQRIRQRIHVAQHVFSTQKTCPEDEFLQQLLRETHHPHYAAQLLKQAERDLDEAAILTIHGFCYRILSQHAFESGTSFNLSLLTESDHLWLQAATDFWRKSFYPLPRVFAKQVHGLWKTPIKLIKTLKPWLNYPLLKLITYPNDTLEKRYLAYEKMILMFKQYWLQHYTQGLSLLKQADIKANDYRYLEKWWSLIQQWAFSKNWKIPSCFLKCLNKMHPYYHTFSHELQQLFDHMHHFYHTPITFHDLFIQQALIGIQAEMTHLKKTSNQFVFDDLLIYLHTALQKIDQNNLSTQIRQTFPIAIIDEFQDTDTIQYQIFQSIYPKNTRSYGLFMIGDPKQAIYSFRGANLFTYIQAKKNTPSQFTLSINWRASFMMVQACNIFFSQHASAFVYDQDIPFIPIQAAPHAKKNAFLLHHKPAAAMAWFTLPDQDEKPINKKTYQQKMAQATVQEIMMLLKLGQQGLCQLQQQAHIQSIQSHDIAILVRTSAQAKMMQAALSEHHIASVYLSERESVLNTQEAKSLYRILKACCYINKNEALLEALATPLLGYSTSELADLEHNESQWDQLTEEFMQYEKKWNQQGIIACIRCILFTRNIPQTLLSQPSGERKLTDLSHLSEILAHAAEKECDTPLSLLNWLYEKIDNPEQSTDFQLHLESDQGLIKIITYHKSKGLEYPVVFMPFICDTTTIDPPYGYFYHDPQHYHPILDLTKQFESKNHSHTEQLAEEVRLIYVGVTRAIYRCYLGLAPIIDGRKKTQLTIDLQQTAIGRLLNIQTSILASNWVTWLQTHWGIYPGLIDITVIETHNTQILIPDSLETSSIKQTTVCSFKGNIEKNWRVTSYTALTRLDTEYQPTVTLTSQPQDTMAAIEPSVFTFPKGSHAGIFLHYLFEISDFKKECRHPNLQVIEHTLQSYGFHATWLPVIKTLMQTVLNTVLWPAPFYLGALNHQDQYSEMEFYLPVSTFNAKTFNQYIQQYDSLSQHANPLTFPQLQGMLKGFIDLVCYYQGKYYIIDYKSNFLGNNPSDYHQDALKKAMISHRYDVQYQLYTLAVHRLLKNKLPHYSYEKNMGGVLYLFIRGMPNDKPLNSNKNTPSGVFFTRPSYQLINALDQLFSGHLIV